MPAGGDESMLKVMGASAFLPCASKSTTKATYALAMGVSLRCVGGPPTQVVAVYSYVYITRSNTPPS